MPDKLPGFVSRIGKAEPIDRIVQTAFEKLKKDFSGDPFPPVGFFEGIAELILEEPIEPFDLLFFS
jgi:hypothetical protein